MSDDRRPLPLAILIALVRVSPLLAWGGWMLWWGLSFGPEALPGPGDDVGVFSFHIFGALLICGALIGAAIIVMRARAPLPRKDRITESGDVTFDADAAIANYLASQKQRETAEAPPPAAASPPRPVFGRRVG